jgi:glutamyl-tRNA synthetase
LWEQSWFFFISPETYDDKVVRKVWKDDTSAVLRDLYVLLESLEPFAAGQIESMVKDLAESKGMGFGKLMNPLRLALVGSNIGPGLMDMMELLGKEEVLKRIDRALQIIKS